MQDEKFLDEIENRFKRHIGVLMEEMRSTVKTVTEQHSDIVKKLDKMERDIDDLKSDMAIVRPAIREHTNQLRELRSEFETFKLAIKDVDARVAENTKRLDRVDARASENTERLDRIEKKLDSVITDHERRLQKLEKV